MAIHAGNQKFRLRLGEPCAIPFSAHEVCGLLQIPGALRLIKDGDMLYRRPGIDQKVVPKMMDILYKSFHALGDFAFPHSNAAISLPRNFVASEGFAQHSDERAIPGKKDGMRRLTQVASFSGYVQTNKSFAGSWHSGDKANDFTLSCSRVVHQVFNPAGRNAKILRPSVETCDGLNGVLRVERTCSFNNGWCGMIWGTCPVLGIDRVSPYGSQSGVERLAKIRRFG